MLQVEVSGAAPAAVPCTVKIRFAKVTHKTKVHGILAITSLITQRSQTITDECVVIHVGCEYYKHLYT